MKNLNQINKNTSAKEQQQEEKKQDSRQSSQQTNRYRFVGVAGSCTIEARLTNGSDRENPPSNGPAF